MVKLENICPKPETVPLAVKPILTMEPVFQVAVGTVLAAIALYFPPEENFKVAAVEVTVPPLFVITPVPETVAPVVVITDVL